MKTYTYEGIELVESGVAEREAFHGEYLLKPDGTVHHWNGPTSFGKFKILIPKEKAMKNTLTIDGVTLLLSDAQVKHIREQLKPKEEDPKVGDWVFEYSAGVKRSAIKVTSVLDSGAVFWNDFFIGSVPSKKDGNKYKAIKITNPDLIRLLEEEFAK